MQGCIALTITTEEVVYRAVELRASREGQSPSQVIDAALRKALAAEIAEASGQPSLAAVLQAQLDAARRARLRNSWAG